jgi:uncharacterized RDD family membrane protein YckC
MASDERNMQDHTNLIDVGEITDFDDVMDGPSVGSEPADNMIQQDESQGPTIAALRDRFAAFVIDISFLYAIFWFVVIIFRTIAFGNAAGPIPASGINGIICNGIFLLIAFLWFLLPEFIFHASLGKMICHLTIRSSHGAQASFTSILLRNLLRPIDIVLAPLLLTCAAMEWTAWGQRFGDLVGRTVVIKKLGRPTRQYALTLDIIASASKRAIAFIIDLALIAAFILGYGLLLNPEQPLSSMFLVVLFPVIILALVTFMEWSTGTTPGKWILGMSICQEDGTPLDFAGALIRTLWRPFGNNPIGFTACLLSLRKQMPGDLAAGTVVLNAPREWRGIIGLVVSLVLIGSVLLAGLDNRDSFLRAGFEVNFLPSIDLKGINRPPRTGRPKNLDVQNFNFAAGDPNKVRRPAIFQPGEMLFIVFDVSGYTEKNSSAWIQEDLSVRYPDDSLGLKLENINDFKQKVPKSGPIRFENNITLPDNAQPGRYTITITLRDVNARRELKEQRFFYITPPKSGSGAEAAGKPTETTLAPEDRTAPYKTPTAIPYEPTAK